MPERAGVGLSAGLLSNRAILFGIAAEVTILLALILIPPPARVFGLAPPSFAEWAPLLGFPIVLLTLEEGRKWGLAAVETPARGVRTPGRLIGARRGRGGTVGRLCLTCRCSRPAISRQHGGILGRARGTAVATHDT